MSAYKVLRGGSWLANPRSCRSAYRGVDHPDYRGNHVGFRVCCLPQDPPPSMPKVLRGGSWLNLPGGCRSAYRSFVHPDVRGFHVGFRVCCLPQDPSDLMDSSNSIPNRDHQHGGMEAVGQLSQSIKISIHAGINWHMLTPGEQEALDMIAHKIGRILSGNDPHDPEHWTDLAGYAHAAMRRREAEL